MILLVAILGVEKVIGVVLMNVSGGMLTPLTLINIRISGIGLGV